MRVNGVYSTLKAWMAIAPVAALLCVSAPALAAGPFAAFSGHWTGNGEISMTDGSKEKIRCKADYSVGPSGDALHIVMNCASDSYKVNIISNVVSQGETFSGTWRETTRQVQGNVTGSVPHAGEYQANLDGTGFAIQIAATTNGQVQAVTIQSQGTDVQGVKISLRKA